LKNHVVILCILLFTSCKFFKNDAIENPPVARVNDIILYKNDLTDIVAKGTDKKDSAQIVQNYIQNWIREQLLLQQAEANLTNDLKDVERQLEEYKKSLIIYAYQEMIITQKLDTVVSENEIKKYYNDNKSNFELRENIVKADYLIFSTSIRKKDADKMKISFRNANGKADKKLMDFCTKYAANYSIGDSVWMRMDELLKFIPISIENQQQFLTSRKYAETNDSSMVYLLNIREFKIKESLSPLDFEKEKIRNIILNLRKLSLLKKMEENIYNEALNKKEFEIFQP